jgi:hypothetical protein
MRNWAMSSLVPGQLDQPTFKQGDRVIVFPSRERGIVVEVSAVPGYYWLRISEQSGWWRRRLKHRDELELCE